MTGASPTSVAAPDGMAARGGRGGFATSVAAHCAAVGAALVLWAVSLTATNLGELSGFGLLAALPPTYYVAIAVLTLGFAAAVAARLSSERLLAAYVVALAVVLHATAPLLYDYPRYAWTYKHLGVIGYIQANGAVDQSIDIYHSWPGFFAANAWLSEVTGVSALTYAGWAQLFFELINVAVLVFTLRGISRDVRAIWVAAWLFLLGNWVAQDYLAPQAFGFVMALLIIGLCLRCATIPGRPRTAVAWWIDRQLRRIPGPTDWLHTRAPRPLARAGAFVVGAICYLAVVVSHQLSPVMVLAAVWTFAVLTRRLPLWIPVAMTAVEAYWVALAWPFVSEWFRLFNPDPTAHPNVYDPSRGLHGLELARYGSWVLTVVLVGAAAAAVLLRLRERKFDVLPIAFAAAPLPVFFLQSYGGEAVFRTYLFALPWLVFLAAAACMPSTAQHVRLPIRAWRFVAVAAVMTPCLLLAFFGYEKANYFGSSDVAAARWWEQHAPRHSALGLIAQNFPSRLTGRYAYARISEASPALTDEGRVRYRAIRPSDLRRIVRMFADVGGRNRYLVINPSQERFSDLYRLLPPGSFAQLRYLLAHSRLFRIVYRNGQAEIYKVLERR